MAANSNPSTNLTSCYSTSPSAATTAGTPARQNSPADSKWTMSACTKLSKKPDISASLGKAPTAGPSPTTNYQSYNYPYTPSNTTNGHWKATSHCKANSDTASGHTPAPSQRQN